MAVVLVTDAGRGNALAVIRSLGRAGHRVIAADDDRGSPGFRSRHAAARVLHEPPSRALAAAADALLDACRHHRVDLVVPVTDEAAAAMERVERRLPAGTRVALPPGAAVDVATDKRATIELARAVGVPVPRTIVAGGVDDVLKAAADIGWPVVVKPFRSRVVVDGSIERRPVGYGATPREVEQLLDSLPAEDVLVQGFEPGRGVGVEVLAHEGRILAAFQHERIREVPFTGGPSSMRRSVALDADLLGHTRRLLEALSWTGLAMVEFKRDGGQVRLMEINGRIWGSLPLAVRAGVDFPVLLARLWLEGPPPPGAPPITSYEVGVRCRNLWLEGRWAWSVLQRGRRYSWLPAPRRREVLDVARDLLRRGTGDDYFSRGDPRPGFAEAWSIARRIARAASAP